MTIRIRMLWRACLFSWALTVSLPLFGMDEPPRLVIDPRGPGGMVQEVLFTPDGKQLISMGADKAIRFWDLEGGSLRQTLRLEIGDASQGQIYAGAISPNGKWLATGGFPAGAGALENPVTLIDLGTIRVIALFQGHQNVINTLSFSDDGHWLASGSADGTIRIWDLHGLQTLGNAAATLEITESEILKGNGGYVLSLAFAPGGDRIASGYHDHEVIFWKRQEDGKFAAAAQAKNHSGEVKSLAYSPDGTYFATGGFDRKILLWDGESGALLKTISNDMGYNVGTISFAPDGRHLVASAAPEGTTAIFDVESGNEETKINRHNNAVIASAWHPKEDLVATAGGNNNEIYLWRPASGEIVYQLVSEGQPGLAAGFDSKNPLRVGFGHTAQYVNDSNRAPLAKAFDFSTLTLFDLQTNPEGFLRTSLQHDGKELKRIDSFSIDTGSGKIAHDPQRYDNVRAYTFIPDGNVLVGSEFTLRLHKPDGTEICDFAGHEGTVWAVAVSPDGKYFTSASQDQTIRLWSLENLPEPLRIAAAGMVIRDIADQIVVAFVQAGSAAEKGGLAKGDIILSANGKTFENMSGLISYTRTLSPGDQVSYAIRRGSKKVTLNLTLGETKILQSVQPLASLFVARDGEWVCWTPSGYFAASTNGGKYIGWHFNKGIEKVAEFLSGDQLYDHFYRPDIVKRSILDRRPSSDIAEEQGITFSLEEALRGAPGVSIASPDHNSRSANRRQQVIVEGIDNGAGIAEVRLFHEGKRINPDGPGSFRGGRWVVPFTVSLSQGANPIRAITVNPDGIESRPEEITVMFEGETAKSNLYLLAVGLNKYRNPKFELTYCKPDVDAFADTFIEGSEGLFSETFVHRLYDENATKPAIEAKLQEFAAAAQPDDVFVFVFAGHGVMSEGSTEKPGEYHLVTYDVTQMYGNDKGLAKDALPASLLESLAAGIPARKQLMILDSCQSGGLVETFAMRGVTEEKALAQLSRATGMHVLASTRTGQYATEVADLGHGLFTYALLEALKGKGDANSDGRITVKEVEAWLNNRVPDLAEQLVGTAQYPNSFGRGQDFPIGLSK